MQGAEDAVSLARALLTADSQAIDRVFEQTPNHGALAANLACMVHLALSQVPEETRETFYAASLRHMRDTALDIRPRDATPDGETPLQP